MAFLDWSNSFNTITQTLTTVVDQTYATSYWVADDQANLLQVTLGGSTLFRWDRSDQRRFFRRLRRI
jgi:hypothetical protein